MGTGVQTAQNVVEDAEGGSICMFLYLLASNLLVDKYEGLISNTLQLSPLLGHI